MRADLRSDRGFSAVWVALVLLFLLGSAALAVDASGGFQTARTDQTTADLSCLAGVVELPDNQSAAIDVAADYVQLNWPQMAGLTPSKTLPTATLDDGNGNLVEFDTSYGGDDAKMWVRVTEQSDTWFAKVIGFDSVTVSQQAWCRVDKSGLGGGLPFGAEPGGGFNGDLQKLNPCETGNCGPLVIPRDDVSGAGPTLIKNIAEGPDRTLQASLGPIAGAADCSLVSAGDICNIVTTDPGVSAAHLGEGMLQRLEDDPGAEPGLVFNFNGRLINGDTRTEILGPSVVRLKNTDPEPVGWDADIHGAIIDVDLENHWYYNGVIAKCDSPRLGFMPIVSENLDWDKGSPVPPWPNGKKDVKVVGFYWVIIVDPNDAGDWQGSGNLKQSSADIIWFGPDVTCLNETPFDPADPGALFKNVLLVNETN